MSKKIVLILFAFVCLNAKAQTVSNYKYVVVPKTFSDFTENQYNLNVVFEKLMANKKYVILPENQLTWPEDAQLNPCLVIFSNVNKQKSFLKNKLDVNFTDCYNKNIGKFEGVSDLKDFEAGYRDALIKSIKLIGSSNPKENLYATNAKPSTSNTEVLSNPHSSKQEVTSNITNQYTLTDAKLFQNGSDIFQLTELADHSFLLINQKSSQVEAKFSPSSNKEVFRVNVTVGNYSSVGYYKDGKLSYEYQASPNEWKVKEFLPIK